MGWKIKTSRQQNNENDENEMNTNKWWKWWWLITNDLDEWNFFIDSSF